jgi:D-apiose dehydrogenase
VEDVRIAVFGCGFWARFQLAAWRELAGVQVVALYNRTRSRAEALGADFGIAAIYDDPEALLSSERVDAIDIITDVDSHSRFVLLAASRGLPAICQKPLAPNLIEAEAMLAACRAAGTRLLVHENWRWQAPIRELKRQLDSGVIGRPFRARLQFNSSFPVFDNQPFLRELRQFIVTDVGSHVLDVARCLFGEAQRVYCQTARVNPSIQGEDVATVILQQGDVTTTCELSYASRLEHERFPETYALIEGSHGSLELGPDYWLRCTTAEGTLARRVPPPRYAWADPAYDLVHASIVPCHADLLRDLRGGTPAETRGEDNINTVRLVFAAYDSARTGQAVVPRTGVLTEHETP